MKRLMIGILSGVALATGGIVLGLSNPASAAVIWDWNYSGSTVIGGSGTFTTTDEQSDGSFLITDITGTSENQTITSLLVPGTFASNDNLLSPDFPQLTTGGFSYSVSAGTNLNLFFSSFFASYLFISSGTDYLVNFTAIARVTPPTVPEPSSFLGYITFGSLMLGSALRKARV